MRMWLSTDGLRWDVERFIGRAVQLVASSAKTRVCAPPLLAELPSEGAR